MREPAVWPIVTVQLPVYNERYVVERLLDAVGALDYPADRLQIQVLDDSTDETCAIIDRVTARLRASGKEVAVIRRARKTGFKGGALAAGTAEARGEFIAIFDADFLPPPAFLKQTIPHFAGARVGCVQTRWGHVNADYSLLTRLQAAGIDGHFMVEQEARNRMGWFIGFNGSAGVWRKTCIESAGGWHPDTLTEDLDLSYRAQLAGWTFTFLTDVVAPAEVPAQMDAYRRQQFRWAKGSVQTAKKLLPALWRAPLSPAVKLQGTLHLTGYLMHLLMVIAFVLTVPVSLVQSPVLALLPYLALTMVGPFCLYGTAVWRRSRSVLNLLGTLVMLVVLGTGMSINNARAAVEALLGINSAFRRTPKFDLRSRADQWRASRYSLPNDPMVWAELSAAALAIGYTANALWHHGLVNDWLLIYALAYSYVSSLSLYQGLGRALIRRRAMPPSAAE
ncbi:MAG: glycosyltransferase [Chloroflexi bacterium]|nr:glycosyltransferase [Chloroflexota bacterium]